VYFPPGVANLLPDAGQELIVTEGEFKALATMQHGFPSIGFVGVFGWKVKNNESLLPEMERIAWQNRIVFIVFDSDIADKADGQGAESRLAAHWPIEGAIVRWCGFQRAHRMPAADRPR